MTLIAPRSDAPSSGGLSVWVDQSDNRCLLLLRGRLCVDTVGMLESHVDLVVCQWCDRVTVDVRRLERLDTVGARVLAGFGHYVAARGGRFEVEGAEGAVARLLEEAESDLSA